MTTKPTACAQSPLWDPNKTTMDPQNPHVYLKSPRDSSIPVSIIRRDGLERGSFAKSRCSFSVARPEKFKEQLSFHPFEDRNLSVDPKNFIWIKSRDGMTHDSIKQLTLYSTHSIEIFENMPELSVACTNSKHNHPMTVTVHRTTGESAMYKLEIESLFPKKLKKKSSKPQMMPLRAESMDPDASTVPISVVQTIQSFPSDHFKYFS